MNPQNLLSLESKIIRHERLNYFKGLAFAGSGIATLFLSINYMQPMKDLPVLHCLGIGSGFLAYFVGLLNAKKYLAARERLKEVKNNLYGDCMDYEEFIVLQRKGEIGEREYYDLIGQIRSLPEVDRD
jgi:hypothetical protein